MAISEKLVALFLIALVILLFLGLLLFRSTRASPEQRFGFIAAVFVSAHWNDRLRGRRQLLALHDPACAGIIREAARRRRRRRSEQKACHQLHQSRAELRSGGNQG